MSKLRHLSPLLIVLLVSLAPLAEAAERTARLDFSAWNELPVLAGGRIQPLQTFARKAVSDITGRERPTINPLHELGEKEYNSESMAAVREKFGAAGERKFDAGELLLSWMVEPDLWEDVPFLLAEHESIRELLGLEIENQVGRLRYVSPAQIMDSPEFFAKVRELGDKQAEAAQQQEGGRFEPKGVDKHVASLAKAFQQYRQLTTNTLSNPRARGRFFQKASEAVKAWSTVYEGLGGFRGHDGELGQLSQSLQKVDAAHTAILEVLKQHEFTVEQIEPAVIEFAAGAAALEVQTARLKERLLNEPPATLPPDKLENLRQTMTLLASKARAMNKHAREMHLALYDEEYPLRVVPALNTAALERDRDTADDAQPWLSMQTVLFGSKELLKDYPAAPLEATRRWYKEMAQAYRGEGDAQQAKTFDKAAGMFAQSMRNLGTEIEPLRRALPVQNSDEDLMNYTAYPPAEHTAVEVRYNSLDPFKWAWVISLLATACFGLSFGVIRKPMFWLGAAVLVAGLAWTVFGFYLRVMITRWAPVTNMYETVVYVPFFVSVLGAWFLFLPLTWEGLKAAWRASAVPGTWEATPLEARQTRHLNAGAWTGLGYGLALVRMGMMALTFYYLALAPIYDGGNTVLSLTPKAPLGSWIGNFNDLVVWVVGLCVLVVTVWYLPRVLIALVGSIVFIPLMLAGRWNEVLPALYVRWPFALTATLVAFLGSYVAWYQPIPGKDFGPLQPVLRSNFWLTIHVLTIVSSYAAGALAWGLGNLALGYFLFGKYRDPVPVEDLPEGHRPASPKPESEQLVAARAPEQCTTLASYTYRAMQVAVLLLAAGTILGGLWADVSWGRFWGWDPKEVFALVSLLVYLAVLHGRYAGLFGNFGLAAGSVLGASAIIMSWYGVNFVLGVGLHSYGFGEGGQAEIGLCVLANWIFLAAAAARYVTATQPRPLSGANVKSDEAQPVG